MNVNEEIKLEFERISLFTYLVSKTQSDCKAKITARLIEDMFALRMILMKQHIPPRHVL